MSIICGVCGGDGVQKLTVSIYGEDGEKITHIQCVACQGEGVVNEQRAEIISYEQIMWCQCDEDHGVTFFNDDEHDIIKKHHYRCRCCKKVVQIG